MALNAIGIASKDIQKSIEFYKLLGLEFTQIAEQHYEAKTPSGIKVMLDSIELLKQINPAWKEPQSPGISLCFLQESPKQVDKIYQRIVQANFQSEKEPWDAFWGQRYASVKDPDGNQVDLFANL